MAKDDPPSRVSSEGGCVVGQTVRGVKRRGGGCQNAPPSRISSEGGCGRSKSGVVVAKNDPLSRVSSEGGCVDRGGCKSSPSLTSWVGEQPTGVVSKLLKIRNNGRTLYARPVVLVLGLAMEGWSGGGC
jgi:hypothetical protein